MPRVSFAPHDTEHPVDHKSAGRTKRRVNVGANRGVRNTERQAEGKHKVYGHKKKYKTARNAKQVGKKYENMDVGGITVKKDKGYICDEKKKCGVVKKNFSPLKTQGEKQVFTGSKGGMYTVTNHGNRTYVTNKKSVKKKLPK